MGNLTLRSFINMYNMKSEAAELRFYSKPWLYARRRLKLRKIVLADLCKLESKPAFRSVTGVCCYAEHCSDYVDPVTTEIDKAAQFQLLCHNYHIVNSEFASILAERNELQARVRELEEANRQLKILNKLYEQGECL